MATDRLIKLSEVKHLTSLSRSRIYFMVKENTFPNPVKISERRVAWVKSEVSNWIEKKIRDANHEVVCEGDAF